MTIYSWGPKAYLSHWYFLFVHSDKTQLHLVQKGTYVVWLILIPGYALLKNNHMPLRRLFKNSFSALVFDKKQRYVNVLWMVFWCIYKKPAAVNCLRMKTLLLSLSLPAYFSLQVIYARRKYFVPPPATTGHPNFERVFRAQWVFIHTHTRTSPSYSPCEDFPLT